MRFVFLLLLGSLLACGSRTGPPPCVTTADCVASICVSGQCVAAPDGGGPGGGGGTTGGGGGGGTDAGNTVDAGRLDAGATTYPDGGSISRYWDGGSCAVKTDCPCFSSDDCGPGFFCHSEDTTGTKVWCVPGARGPGAVGAPCSSEADCFSSLCIEASDGGNGCSALCETAAECAPSLPQCRYIGFGVDRSICSP
ncbi:MAG: hypothetical protein QM817_33455 [Archangium sp.]